MLTLTNGVGGIPQREGPMLTTSRTLGTYKEFSAVEERREYLSRPPELAYYLDHQGARIFSSSSPQPVVGVLAGLMLEGV